MSRKASPAYLKSRMSSFLNPLFLGSVVTLALIAVVVWQFAGANQRAGNPNPNPNGQNIANNNQIPAGFEAPENAQNPDGTVPNNGQPQQGQPQQGQPKEEETIDPNFLSQTTTGEEILEPIAPGAQQQQQARSIRLYDQLVGLNLFPDLLPNQGGQGGDPINQATGGNVASQYSSSYQNQYTQYQYRNSISGQVSNGPTPLGQAVNTVMSNSNYARYASQQQPYQGQQSYQGQQPYQEQQSYQGQRSSITQNTPVGNNLSFPNIAPTYFGSSAYGGGSAYTPTYGAPNPYGGAVSPYAASSFSPYGGY